jgi:hypothetical protein
VSTGTTHREAERMRRIDGVRFGALVRQQLGQCATYRRLDDGRHCVTVGGQTAVGVTLQSAIDQAREYRP